MKSKICAVLSVLVALGGITLLSSCGEREPSYDDRETFPQETYVAVGAATVFFRDGLDRSAYPAGTKAGEWLIGCSASDRDEQFDVYTLRHESSNGESTTFTYLIYYPHGGDPMTATPEVLAEESGYVVNLTYGEGNAPEGYTLSYLSVTLPTDEAPRLRLLLNRDVLGQLSSVTGEELPLP